MLIVATRFVVAVVAVAVPVVVVVVAVAVVVGLSFVNRLASCLSFHLAVIVPRKDVVPNPVPA